MLHCNWMDGMWGTQPFEFDLIPKVHNNHNQSNFTFLSRHETLFSICCRCCLTFQLSAWNHEIGLSKGLFYTHAHTHMMCKTRQSYTWRAWSYVKLFRIHLTHHSWASDKLKPFYQACSLIWQKYGHVWFCGLVCFINKFNKRMTEIYKSLKMYACCQLFG